MRGATRLNCLGEKNKGSRKFSLCVNREKLFGLFEQ